MSRKPSTDLEHPSEIPTWIVLICSGLALVMFFGWIVEDLSEPASPDQAKSVLVRPLSEAGPIPDILENSANTIKLADSQPVQRASSGNPLPLKGDKESTVPKGSPTPTSARESTAQATQRIAAKASVETLKNGKSSTEQKRQLAGQEDAERTSNQQHATELPATERSNQRGVAEEEGKIAAYASKSQSDKANEAEQATGSSKDITPGQDQRPSADLGALRQLLAEAAAINKTDDEQVRAERDELEALGKLSSTIRFALGSKVASESMTPALNQIQRILADYPETTINVIVATNESDNQKQDLLLSQERGRTLIARLVNRGLAFSRFSLKAWTDDQLPANTHRVEIQAHSKS